MPWPKHFGSKEIIVKLRDLLILAGSVAAASHVSALSLGNTQGQVQLGSPIDLVFPVQPDAGQTAESSCITADVWMGNAALTSGQVLVTAQEQSVRVRTTAPVYEPLITLKLRAGCTGGVSRSYTFFADPPKSLAASVVPIDLSTIQFSPPVAASRPAAVKNTAPANKAPRAAKKAVNPKAALAQPLAAAAAPAAAATVIAEPATPKESIQEPAPAPASAEKPRLRIEPLEGLDTPTDSTPPSQSEEQSVTSAAIDPETQALLDANQTRLEALEKQLLSMQSQLTNNRAATTSLQSQLVQAQNPDLPLWVHIMLGLLALALATIAWLMQRIKKERHTAQSAWANTVLAAEDSVHSASVDTRATTPASAFNEVERKAPPAANTVAVTEASVANAHAPGADTQPATALPDLEEAELYAAFEPPITPVTPPTASEPQPPSPSIAEVLTAQALFDVQEQAEFYASIGENDQAIQILQAHIAEHETSAPLAYIELLQLLYRLSRTEAFEEVREKFEAHFNVKVPDFLGFSRKGRDLSGYPEILGQIEALWPTDEVQGLMRNLIVRRPNTTPAEANVRFDLAAFDDLLMLYNVAQTTPASSRGQLPGRVRMTPLEVPLPELVFDSAPTPTNQASSSFGSTATLASPPLPLHEAHLDMLTATPMEAPLPASNRQSDSPFQSPTHFSPSEVLVDDLSLDWDTSKNDANHKPAPDTSSMDAEINFFTMDERDLPTSPPPGKAQ